MVFCPGYALKITYRTPSTNPRSAKNIKNHLETKKDNPQCTGLCKNRELSWNGTRKESAGREGRKPRQTMVGGRRRVYSLILASLRSRETWSWARKPNATSDLTWEWIREFADQIARREARVTGFKPAKLAEHQSRQPIILRHRKNKHCYANVA